MQINRDFTLSPDYQCVTEGAVASSRHTFYVEPDIPLENIRAGQSIKKVSEEISSETL